MKDTTALHPILQAKIKQLTALCEAKGLKIKITECARTVEEQDALYAKGRTTKGNVVTNAKGSTYSSMHQWGVAFDFCRNDGKGAYYNKDNFFEKVGKIGQSIGLEWGGSWSSIVDLPHFQLPDWGSTTKKLREQYGKPEVFIKTWPRYKVGAKVACQTAVFVRTEPNGKKAAYKDMTATMKSKCEEQKDGTAKFKALEEFTVAKLDFTDDGKVYGSTKSGLWLCLYDGKAKRFK